MVCQNSVENSEQRYDKQHVVLYLELHEAIANSTQQIYY